MKIDQVFIGSMLGQEELGIYSSAVKLSAAWYFIPTVVTASVFPAILNAKKKSRKLYYKRFQMLFDGFTWFTIVVALLITFLSPFIIRILYGEEFIEAAKVLSVHIWAGPAVFLGVASGKYLIAENQIKLSLYRTLFGMVVNLFLNIFLIPQLGIMGAAYTTVGTYFVSTYSIIIFRKGRDVGLNLLRSFDIIGVGRRLKNV